MIIIFNISNVEHLHYTRFEDLVAVTVKGAIFWDVARHIVVSFYQTARRLVPKISSLFFIFVVSITMT
jgi:hypothetical protein